jgi:transcriptional regulator GlxA family with amidase domain
MSATRNVAIFIFDDVEVFSVTGRRAGQEPFHVFTCAEKAGPVFARNQLSVNPRYTLATAPRADILVIPGGFGTRREMNNPVILEWLQQSARDAEIVLSVCTGALILGKAGLLNGLTATTHFGAIELLRETAPGATVRDNMRFVDNGKIITAAGISAGIDASLYLVGRLLGLNVAEETARYMEYDWRHELDPRTEASRQAAG